MDSVFAGQTWVSFDSSGTLFARTPKPNSYGPNLLFNGNFALGDTGFETELAYRTQPCQGNSYRICKSSDEEWACSPPWVGGKAKDANVTDSLMMYLTLVKQFQAIWRQSVPVRRGQYYSFSLWTLKFNTQTARVVIKINGTEVSPTLYPRLSKWEEYAYTWYSGNDDSATILIENIVPCGFGWPPNCDNAFAFDDLSFRMLVDSISGEGMSYDSAWLEVIRRPFDKENSWEADSLLCVLTPLELEVDAGFNSVRWRDSSESHNFKAVQTGIYSFTARNKDNCLVADSVFIWFNDLPEPEIIWLNDYLYTTTPAPKYCWFIDGFVIPNSDTTAIRVSLPGIYKLLVYDEGGCERGSEMFVLPLSTPETSGNCSLYPNPVKDHLYIHGVLPAENIEVYSATGLLLKQFSNQQEIDLHDLLPGVYFIKINHLYTYKIMKR